VRYYGFAEITVTDAAWIGEYVTEVTRIIERRGGRYLARTGRVEAVEGESAPTTTVVLLEWPSKEAADEFYESEEYRPYREQRKAGATNRLLLIAGEDVTGAANVPG